MKKLLLPILVAVAGIVFWERRGAASSERLIDLDVQDAPLAEVARLLEKASGQPIVAANSLGARITLHLHQQTLETILRRVADQANAICIMTQPIYGTDASLRELRGWFTSGAPVATWKETTNLFAGDRRMIYFRDANEPEPLVTLAVTNVAAIEAAALVSQAAGAHVLLEDQLNPRISLSLKDQTVQASAQELAARLGRKTSTLRVLQPKPKQLTQIGAAQREVRETAGNTERIIRRGPSPEERAKMEKLVAMTPEERRAFLLEDFNNRAAARQLDRLRTQTPEQRVDARRNGGGEEQIQIRK